MVHALASGDWSRLFASPLPPLVLFWKYFQAVLAHSVWVEVSGPRLPLTNSGEKRISLYPPATWRTATPQEQTLRQTAPARAAATARDFIEPRSARTAGGVGEDICFCPRTRH